MSLWVNEDENLHNSISFAFSTELIKILFYVAQKWKTRRFTGSGLSNLVMQFKISY